VPRPEGIPQVRCVRAGRFATVLLVLATAQSLPAADFLYTWPASTAPGLQGYAVYQGVNNGNFQLLDEVELGMLSDPQHPAYLVSGLEPGTYRFQSAAISASGEEPPSNQTCVTVGSSVVECDADDDDGAVVYIHCFIAAGSPPRK
jgi:hypothetical protein